MNNELVKMFQLMFSQRAAELRGGGVDAGLRLMF